MANKNQPPVNNNKFLKTTPEKLGMAVVGLAVATTLPALAVLGTAAGVGAVAYTHKKKEKEAKKKKK